MEQLPTSGLSIQPVAPKRLCSRCVVTRHYHSVSRFTPCADELTLAAAAALMDAESIDKDRSTDLLAIRFAATDYVGHAFGLDSLEAEDNLFRLDNIMANLLTLVEDKVRLEHTLVVLTTHHGTSSVPECLVSCGEHAARIDTLGHLLPAIFKYVGAMEVAQVNLPVAVLIFIGMPTRHVTFVKKLRMQVARST